MLYRSLQRNRVLLNRITSMPLNQWNHPINLSKKIASLNDGKPKAPVKFIFVTGGVISGIGKGVTTSVIGSIMKACGYPVTAIKIDPYLNIDAGTFSPYEHGEVFVLDDGSEVDLDLGNYERMLNVRLNNFNNITTGKIYDNVIKKERKGSYLGKTVQVVPHITDEIQNWIESSSQISIDDQVELPIICFIEVGGIIGDIESMPFLEAIRQFQTRVKRENYSHIHISLIPETIGGELKTKPTQMSVKVMRSLGLSPDFIACRAVRHIDDDIKNKISLFCDVPTEKILSLEDVSDIYQIIPLLYNQNIAQMICAQLYLSKPNLHSPLIQSLLDFSKKSFNTTEEVSVAIVGKYVKNHDAYHSIQAALVHSALFYNKKIKIIWVCSDSLEDGLEGNHLKRTEEQEQEYLSSWRKVKEADGIIIPGGFDKRGIEGKILAVNYARKNRKPILGICLGLQVMVIEFARFVLGLKDANSQEIDVDTQNPVVVEMPEFNPEQKGASMRLGLRKTVFNTADSHTSKLYETSECIYERHRHRYEFNPKYRKVFEQGGFRFVGQDDTGQRMEIVELPESIHPYFVGVQYHPEFLSRPLSPSPVFKGLIRASIDSQQRS